MTDTTVASPEAKPPIRITPLEDDSHSGRNWLVRWIEHAIWFVLFIPGGAILLGWIVPLALLWNFPGTRGWISFIFGWLGAFIGLWAYSKIAGKRLFKEVPRNQGLLPTDLRPRWLGGPGKTGSTVKYGPGLHASSFFEEVHEDDNISIAPITLIFHQRIATASAEAIVDGFVQVRASISRLDRAGQITEETLQKGLVGVIESYLQSLLAKSTVEEQMGKVVEISEAITRIFGVSTSGGTPHQADQDEPTDFEMEYGYDLIAVGITSLDLPESVQKARDANAQLEQVLKLVAKLAGAKNPEELTQKLSDGKIPLDEYRRYIQFALMATKAAPGTINVQEIAGTAPNILGAIAGNQLKTGNQGGNS